MPDPKHPEPLTPAAMRALAEEHEKEAARLASRAKQLRHAADVVEALEREPVESISPLPSGSQSGITDSMNSTQIDSGPKKRRTGPPLKSKGPAAKVARILGVSLAELADLAKVNVHSLRTWDQREHLPAEVQGKLADLVRAHEKQTKRAR